MTARTLHAARSNARRARLRHDRYLDHLLAQGTTPTVEQRRELDLLAEEKRLAAWELRQEQQLAAFRRRGLAVAS